MKKTNKKLISSFLIMGFVLILTFSCKKEETTQPVTPVNLLTVGQTYQGGKIAYLLKAEDPGYSAAKQHGLIAAPSDQSTGISWYDVWMQPPFVTTTTEIGSGNANTNAIYTALGDGGYAAAICYNLVLGGYSDWYLPSKDELNKLYINRVAIGGFTPNIYWSSSQYSGNVANIQNFTDGAQTFNLESMDFYVRAIRSF